jgi:hypothetical protein
MMDKAEYHGTPSSSGADRQKKKQDHGRTISRLLLQNF